MFDLIASHVRTSAAAGATGGTLQVASDGVRDFAPAAGLYSFAIGGEGTPEKKIKRVTARVLENWLAPFFGSGMVPPFIGWWLENDRIVLDVPTIWTGTDYEKTRARAVEIGRDRGERAIYDFTAAADIDCKK